MKTSELSGLALTWVLLRLEHPDEYFSIIRNEGKVEIWFDRDVGTSHPTLDREGKPRFIRASDGVWVSLFGNPVDVLRWGFCGPIIEREDINLSAPVEGDDCGWTSLIRGENKYWACGPTSLIAAMRCYVASKLGEEVEIPEELKGE
jgi:hypothetical protein